MTIRTMTCRGTAFALGLAAFGCSSSEPGTSAAAGTPGDSSALDMNPPSTGGATPASIGGGAGKRDGTLMVSSHMPGFEDTFTRVANQHAFMEFEIDRANQVLIEKWVYTDGPEWAQAKGMSIRLPNGNALGNYGTGGVIRAITPDKQTVFHVKFDGEGGEDFYEMVGHDVLIDDLYALDGGPSAPWRRALPASPQSSL